MPRTARGAAAAVVAALVISAAVPARACDLHTIYSAVDLRDSPTGVRVGVAEQYSYFGTLQRDGDEIANPDDERLHSSITQLVIGYQPFEQVGVQLNLPIMTRHFRRTTADGIDEGDESGFGDLALSVRYRPVRRDFDGGTFRLSLLAGVTLPSGDSDRLAEEAAHHEDGETATIHKDSFWGFPRHDPHQPGETPAVESGVHGHDLALGSGSVDAFFGGDLVWLWQRYYLTAGIQYRLRNRGSFDYEYADDLAADIGPGYFLWIDNGVTLAARGHVSVETKGKDNLAGEILNDTAMTALYAGPGLHFTWGSHLLAEIEADIPAIQNNSDLQVVPDFRLRAGVTWRF